MVLTIGQGNSLTYRTLWGAGWKDGPSILAEIVYWMRGKQLILDPIDPHEPTKLGLRLPIPDVSIRGGPRVCIDQMIPQYLHVRFEQQTAKAVQRKYDMVKGKVNAVLGQSSDYSAALVEAILERHEKECFEGHNPQMPTLQMIVAEEFGFFNGILPPKLGIALDPK